MNSNNNTTTLSYNDKIKFKKESSMLSNLSKNYHESESSFNLWNSAYMYVEEQRWVIAKHINVQCLFIYILIAPSFVERELNLLK